MLQPKLRSVFGAVSMGVIALVGGAGPSKAAVLSFGSVVPSNFVSFSTPACTHSGPNGGGDPGYVCSTVLTYPLGVGTDINGLAISFQGPPTVLGRGGGFLTLKPAAPVFLNPPTSPAINRLGQSGLGNNDNVGPGNPCTDLTCEIQQPFSVAFVTAPITSALLADAVIGSVQSGETFQFWIEDSSGTFVMDGPAIGSNCAGTLTSGQVGPGPDIDTCMITGLSTAGVAVQDITGDVLLVSVSSPAVPEPASLALLGTALLVWACCGIGARE
jgi:hypothetical protein